MGLGDGAIERALDTLPEIERRVIELRFGLGGREPQSIESVRKELGVSRERLRRLEHDALERLSWMRELQEPTKLRSALRPDRQLALERSLAAQHPADLTRHPQVPVGWNPLAVGVQREEAALRGTSC